jgi:polyhydroxybutyrate depolymerase
MNRKKWAIGVAAVLLGTPVVGIAALYAFFYSVFYFPNWDGVDSQTLVSSGAKREYLLYVPKSYSPEKPTPLVLTLHTSMSWPTSAMHISQWNTVAEQQGFIVAYPAGTGGGAKSWEMAGSDSPARMPDVIFISDLIDHLQVHYNIDKTRIYANGMSNGGGMAFVLSCTLSQRLAAIGLVSAGIDLDWSQCNRTRPIPLIAFHGTADLIVPYNGGPAKFGGSSRSIPQFVADWAGRNQCKTEPILSATAKDVERREYRNCANGSNVDFYTIAGEGHQWPGGKPIIAQWLVGPYSRSVDATRLMWEFFRIHPAPNP